MESATLERGPQRFLDLLPHAHSAREDPQIETTRELMLYPRRDREWQKWPITIVTGAYIGWFVGRLVGEHLIRGKRIEFD